MVACAAVATHPPISLAVPMTSCALTVEQLKQHLVAAIENVSEDQIDLFSPQIARFLVLVRWSAIAGNIHYTRRDWHTSNKGLRSFTCV